MKQIKEGDQITFTNGENELCSDIVNDIEGRVIYTDNNESVDISFITKVNGELWLANVLNQSSNAKVRWLKNYWLEKEDRTDEQEIVSEYMAEMISEIANLSLSRINRENILILDGLKILKDEGAKSSFMSIALASMNYLIEATDEQINISKNPKDLNINFNKFNKLKLKMLSNGISEIPTLINDLQQLYDNFRKDK